ncbi:MAG: sugar ABC transporter permease [Chloroflexi bacterium]|nr:sugar ABC transporter permease [Chloroflexota bacterium]
MSLASKSLTPASRKGPSWLPYLLISPTLVIVLVFTAWPTVQAIYTSFFRQYLNIAKFRTPTFVGLENYKTLLTSPDFHEVLRNTAIYVVGTVPTSIVLAFLFALLVNRTVKGIGLARLAFFYPTILPMVSAATIWMFFFTPDYGLFNTALRALGYHGPQNWLGNPHLALLAVMIVAVWKNAGYLMIFYLAGLQNLPTDVFEAASIDGASWWTQLWKIAFPLLRRTTLFVSTIAIIDAFQVVDHIFVLTQGGPSQSSSVLLYYLWQVRFEDQNVGLASALTVVLIVIMLSITVTNFVLSEREGA